jgi:hypothetical protein
VLLLPVKMLLPLAACLASPQSASAARVATGLLLLLPRWLDRAAAPAAALAPADGLLLVPLVLLLVAHGVIRHHPSRQGLQHHRAASRALLTAAAALPSAAACVTCVACSQQLKISHDSLERITGCAM